MDLIPKEIQLLDVSQVAIATGLGIRTIFRWSKAGKFPSPVVRDGKIVRWRERDIADWIEKQEQQIAAGAL
ncbi:MAG: AlpA family phage regulatory protein [bacterium]